MGISAQNAQITELLAFFVWTTTWFHLITHWSKGVCLQMGIVTRDVWNVSYQLLDKMSVILLRVARKSSTLIQQNAWCAGISAKLVPTHLRANHVLIVLYHYQAVLVLQILLVRIINLLTTTELATTAFMVANHVQITILAMCVILSMFCLEDNA